MVIALWRHDVANVGTENIVVIEVLHCESSKYQRFVHNYAILIIFIHHKYGNNEYKL